MAVGKKSIQRANLAGSDNTSEKRFTESDTSTENISKSESSYTEIPVEYISGAYSVDNVTSSGLFAPLVDSVKKYGILQPILLRRIDDNSYSVISGHKRFFAAKKLGFKSVPAVVLDVSAAVARELTSELAKYETVTAYSGSYRAVASASRNSMPDYLL